MRQPCHDPPHLHDEGRILRAATKSDEVVDLEWAAAMGWRALDTHRLGEWLLRASSGFTGRANSCLPLGDPGMPVAEAIANVTRWYDDHGSTPMFQLPRPYHQTDAVIAHVAAAGWHIHSGAIVMTAPATDVIVAGSRPHAPRVRVDDRPDEAWLDNYHYRGGELPAHAMDVLVKTETVGFANIDDDGDRRVAIARGAVTSAPSGRRWLGVTAVEVVEQARRRGLGSRVMAGISEWGRQHGATDVYVQVAPENSGAVATYERLGFTEHHRYHYYICSPSLR